MNIYSEIRSKRKILRDRYGGTMSGADLRRELRMGYEGARRFGEEHGLVINLDGHVRYDTDRLAETLVRLREGS